MRTLTLKKETLAALTEDELSGVVAAAPTMKECGPTLSLTCASEIDRCFTAWHCTRTV